MMNKDSLSRSLLPYIGIVLFLSGSIAAKGEDMTILLIGGIAILLLEALEFKQTSHRNGPLVQLTISSALLLVVIIKIIESIGKNFTAHHLYLTMMLIGLILILIEGMKRYQATPE